MLEYFIFSNNTPLQNKDVNRKNKLDEQIEKLKNENDNLHSDLKSKENAILDLRNKKDSLYSNLTSLKEKNENLKYEQKNLNSDLYYKKEDIKNLKSQNDNLKSQNENLKNQIENLKSQIEKLNSSLKTKEIEINYCKNIIEEIKDSKKDENLIKYLDEKTKNEKLINQLNNKEKIKEINESNNESEIKKLNYELNRELNQEKNKNSNLQNEIEKLKISKNEKFEKYKKNDYNEEFIGKGLDTFYDIVINITSIKGLSNKDEGWPIKWNKNINNIKEFLKANNKLLKVGILGNGNKGKSFLLSRIFNEIIPSGYSVITEGLSIKINQENFYALLDSAGFQTPLLINNESQRQSKDEEEGQKEYENLYRDKTQTENFIQNLILHLSDMLLIVVGKITIDEQKFINKIKNEIKNLNCQTQKQKKPMLFIIHNLSNFQTISEVKNHIEDTLLKSASFKLKEVFDIVNSQNGKKDQRYYFTEESNDILIYHLIMARELTEAGDFYNNYTYKFLKERFNDFPHRTPLSILEEIKNKFAEWSTDLLEEKIEPDSIIIQKEGEVETQFIYNNENGKEIIPKACISDALGLSIYRSSDYEPSYICYIEDNKKLVVELELAGEVEIEDAYADLFQSQIIIKGNKNDTIEKNNKNSNNEISESGSIKILKNTRKYGKFNLIISFGNQIKLADEDPIDETEEEKNSEKKNGIKTIKFKLAKRRGDNKKNN